MSATRTATANVAYKGDAPALADLVGGNVDPMFETSPPGMPYVKSDKRWPTFPGVPKVAEAGVPDYKAVY